MLENARIKENFSEIYESYKDFSKCKNKKKKIIYI